MTPDISIIVPAYNSARFIADTLRTAQAQQGVRSEIILARLRERMPEPALPRRSDLAEAQARAYAAVDSIDFADGFCRRDIGWREVARERGEG